MPAASASAARRQVVDLGVGAAQLVGGRRLESGLTRPYDDRAGGRMSLRGNADEVTERLSAEIALRVESAGVHIVESRLTRPKNCSTFASPGATHRHVGR